jgi:hypothetical protein
MPEDVRLDLGCPHCGGKLTCEFVEWDSDAPNINVPIVCPHCSREWTAPVPARLAWVTTRRPNLDVPR